MLGLKRKPIYPGSHQTPLKSAVEPPLWAEVAVAVPAGLESTVPGPGPSLVQGSRPIQGAPPQMLAAGFGLWAGWSSVLGWASIRTGTQPS